ncbi:methyl-accepting chemotaxis protein [Oceanobacillus limi]|uniref:Methyl-accepting chemotaxis protein n=1 Tax=Oceanobacillus limi TaxID=930131 RepID=A0A1I0AF58_9BACI|nr:methyl-accepting chemotaxis protein [Oceanobacillus limi]SES92799.1 methyl-accepting chemotaxis protein [Oceanobacillus limi]
MELTTKGISFIRSIKFKLLIIVIISSAIGSPIAGGINALLTDYGILHSGISTMITFLVNILTIPVLVIVFTHFFIIKRIKIINENLAALDKGNFEIEFHDNWNDEISLLSRNIELLATNLEKFITSSQDQSTIVYNQSKGFKTSFDFLTDKNNQQNDLLSKINQSNENITKTFENNSAILQEITTAIENTSLSVQKINNRTTESSQYATQSQQALNNISGQIQRIQDGSTHTATLNKGLDEKASEIEEVVIMIKDIADQTNLLALNASIEAARAGEHGKGFSIVAEEVRKLAEHSIDASGKIGTTINAIQQDVQTVVESMKDDREEINDGVHLFSSVHEKIEKVLNQLKGYSKEVDHISTTMEEVTASSQEIAAHTEQSKQKITDNNETFDLYQNIQQEVDGIIADGLQEINVLLNNAEKLDDRIEDKAS